MYNLCTKSNIWPSPEDEFTEMKMSHVPRQERVFGGQVDRSWPMKPAHEKD